MGKNKEFEKLINISTVLFVLSIIFLFIIPLLCYITFPTSIFLMIKAKNKYPKEFEKLTILQQKTHTAEAWAKKYKVKHIQGVNFADFEQTLDLTINKNELIFSERNKELIKINNSEINNLEILEELEQTQKNKSVIARAIVGGLLLGGVGAVVGGLSGACPTLKTNKKYYLEITTNGPDKVIITTDNNSLKQIKTTIYNQIKG